MPLQSRSARWQTFQQAKPGCSQNRQEGRDSEESGSTQLQLYRSSRHQNKLVSAAAVRSSTRNLQHNLPIVLPGLEQLEPFYRPIKRENVSDLRSQLPLSNPRRKLLPRRFHDLALLREICQPQSLHAGRLGVHRAQIDLRSLPRRRPVLDHASKVSQTAQTLGSMLSAQHFEDGIYAFAMSQILHDLFIVVLLVVDPVLQAKWLHAREFFVRRRCSVHVDLKQLSNLHSRRPYSSSDGVNQHAVLFPRYGGLGHASPPICQQNREEVDRKKRRLV